MLSKRFTLTLLLALGLSVIGDVVFGACTAGNPTAGVIEDTPTSDFSVQNIGADVIVTHAKTGLMWKQCSEGQSGAGCVDGSAIRMKWAAALAASMMANTANGRQGYGGYNDWRLPNRKELDSIVELCGYNPAINQTVFPATPPQHFWSASTSSMYSTHAWFVYFGNGGSSDARKFDDQLYVRLVRGGGDSLDSFDLLLVTYSVAYDANGASSGTIPSAQTKSYGLALTLATNTGTLAKTGFTFAGWNTAANGTGTDYADGATYTGNAALTLYAKWTPTYTVGGTLSGLGLNKSVTLQNNASDVLTILSNGNFNFATPVSYGGAYAVTIKSQPVGQTCTVTNGAGTNLQANVTSITVDCLNNTLTIAVAGTGRGNVTSTPAGIDCGSTCSAAFGSDVTLTPTSNIGSMFSGWTGTSLPASWSDTGSTSVARDIHHTATLLSNGKVLVVGGYGDGYYPTSAEIYDPATATFAAAGTMIAARFGHTATLLPSGKVLVAGGYYGGPLSSAELYDPANNNWSTVGNMAEARNAHTATLLANGKVLVVAGQGQRYGLPTTLSSAEVYDPATNTWSPVASMDIGRISHIATRLPNSKVLVVAGYSTDPVGTLSSAELYDPATNTWAPVANMDKGRYNHAATLLPSGKVMVVGGYNNGAQSGYAAGYLSSAELYDPASNTWAAAGGMIVARSNTVATLLPNGQVLVVGGYNDRAVPDADVYDPTTNAWTPTESLGIARTRHSATLLPNGKVLVVGGSTLLASLSSAEIWGVSDVPLTVTLTESKALNAAFTLNTYGIAVTSSEPAGGTLSCTPNPVPHGGSSTCTAVATTGYTFSAFGGDCSGSTCNLTNLNSAKSVTATFTLDPTAPTVVTGTASGVAPTGATLNGTVSSNRSITTLSFDYGLTTGYGSATTATPGSLAADAADAAVSAALTGLTCNTTYHFRVVATNSAGTSNGADTTFTTAACPPGAFLKISPPNAATGLVRTPTLTWGASNGATSYEYCYDTTNDNTCTSWTSAGSATSASLSGLTEGTTYYWQARANNSSGMTFADGSNNAYWSFTIQPAPTYSVTYQANGATGGSVPVDASSYLAGTTVTVLGNTGSLVKTGYAFAGWNTQADGNGTTYSASGTFAIGAASVTLYAKWTLNTYSVTYDANGATSGTIPSAQTKSYGVDLVLATNTGALAKTGYTFAGWNTAANGTGTDYAVGATYTGNAALTLYAKWSSAPLATTSPATGLTTTTATLNASVSSNGGSTAVSFQYGRTTSYTDTVAASPGSLAPNAVNTAVSAALSGLACNSTYHFRVGATNSAGTSYGDDLRFLTAACDSTGLTVKPLGNGIGTITSNPAGINCGADCSESLPIGTSVTLTATNTFHESVFAHWGGTCAGTQPTCTLRISGPTEVIATFAFTGNTLAKSAYDQVQDAYMAYYGRPADPAGRAYWAGRTDALNRGLDPIIGEFGYSEEFKRRYGGMSSTDLVTGIYRQLLARDPDSGGLAFYVGKLDTGAMTLQRITLDVLYGVRGGDDAITVANKKAVANYFSDKVAAGCPYGTEQDGLDVLALADLNTATVTEAIAIIDRWCGQ